MSTPAKFARQATTPAFIYKGAFRPDLGPTHHHYHIFNRFGRELESFYVAANEAIAETKRRNLKTVSAAHLLELQRS